jgi:hypothetical protein
MLPSGALIMLSLTAASVVDAVAPTAGGYDFTIILNVAARSKRVALNRCAEELCRACRRGVLGARAVTPTGEDRSDPPFPWHRPSFAISHLAGDDAGQPMAHPSA